MSTPQVNAPSTCPDCGATLGTKADYCWLCRKPLPAGPVARAQAPAHPEARAARSFSVTSPIVFVTLVTGLVGAFLVDPGIGIGMAILLAIPGTPALVWTWMAARQSRARGTPMTPLAQVSLFAGTLGAVIVVCVVSGIAFVFTWCGGLLVGAAVSQSMGVHGEAQLGWALLTGFLLGIVAAVAAAYSSIRSYVHRARRKEQHRP